MDLANTIVPKQFQDVVGYYNRFDVFEFKVNRRAHRPAHFHGEIDDDDTRADFAAQRAGNLDAMEVPPVTLAS